jgi:Uma2 family endonuclease
MSVLAQKTNRLVTAEELERLPSDYRCELIEGVLREMPPPPGEQHGTLTFRFALRVGVFVEENKLGRCYAAETGFIIARDPDTVLAADFAFMSKDRLADEPVPGYASLAPDVVLETQSPSDASRRVAHKRELWLNAGVKMVLELNPSKKTLTVYRPGTDPKVLGLDDTFLGEDVLPGFSLPLRKIFQDSV